MGKQSVGLYLNNEFTLADFIFFLNREIFHSEKQEIRIKHYESDVGQMRCKYSECKHPAFDFFKFQTAKVEKKKSLKL